MSDYDYSAYTYNSKNPLARFSHRSRLGLALQLVPLAGPANLLDYGCGDGKMLRELQQLGFAGQLTGFDPLLVPDIADGIAFHANIEDLRPGHFDFLLCLEVLEHFNRANQKRMLAEMAQLLQTQGRALISVPIETGFPSLVKNLRRLSIHPDEKHNWTNTWKCFWGIEVPEVRSQAGFIPSHIGFNHQKLEEEILIQFHIRERRFSPFSWLGAGVNAQVFYQLEKR